MSSILLFGSRYPVLPAPQSGATSSLSQSSKCAADALISWDALQKDCFFLRHRWRDRIVQGNHQESSYRATSICLASMRLALDSVTAPVKRSIFKSPFRSSKQRHQTWPSNRQLSSMDSPAAWNRVGSRSMVMTGEFITVPGSITPGQAIAQGTRIPPS